MRRIVVTGIVLALLLPCTEIFAQAPENQTLRNVVDPATAPATPAKEGKEPPPAPAPAPDPMALQFKRISQLMMVTFEGVNGPSPTDRQILQNLTPGAIIVPRITDPETAAGYVQGLRPYSAAAFEKLPIAIGVNLFSQELYADQPRVSTVLRVPTMLSIAAAGPSPATAAVFRMFASNLRAMGFDFNLGPTLALAPAPGLKGGSIYSFGSDPSLCSALAQQFGKALQDQGVTWMPMGYPGGAGDPPVLLTPASQLRNRDLLPYADAVAAGVRMFNIGPTLAPTLDETEPALFSPIINRDLRNDVLGYKGLVVAGPIDARGIRSKREPERAAVEALLAGADMLYWSGSNGNVAKATAAIVDAVQKGAIDNAVIDRAIAHIREFKKSLSPAQSEKDLAKSSSKLTRKQEKFPEPIELERRAITLVRNESAVLPLTRDAAEPVAVVGVFGADDLKTALEKRVKLISARDLSIARHATRIEDFELARIVRMFATYRTVICIVSDDIDLVSQQRLIRALKSQGQRVVAVYLGFPTNLPELLDADALLLGFGSVRRVGDTMRAVADVLMGSAPVEILPPLRPLTLHPGEQTTFNVNDVIRSPVGRLPVAFDPPFVAGYSVSYQPIAPLKSVRWDFGDGSKSKDLAAAHAYEKPGDYVVTLSVGDGKTGKTTGTFQVHVQ